MRVENKKEPVLTPANDFKPAQPAGKVFFLAGLVVASTALFWLAWHNVITTGIAWNKGAENIVVIFTTLLAFCLMFGLLAMAEVLIISRFVLLIMAVLAGGTVFIFFIPSFWMVVAFLIITLGFLYWRRELRLDIETRSEFVPSRTIGAGLRPVVTVILLAAAVTYYSFLTTAPQASARLQERLTDTATNTVSRVLQAYYKDKYSSSMTLDEFIEQIWFVRFENYAIQRFNTGNEEFDQALEEGLATAKVEAIEAARGELLETFKIEATGDETMWSVVHKVVNKNFDKYVSSYQKAIPAILALGLFFIIIIFRFIYQELIKSFGYLLFHVFVWLKFIKVEKVTIEAERLTLT